MYKEYELNSISSSNVIKFIISRFDRKLPKATSSRGKHYFQHSRTSIEQYVSIMKDLYNVSGSGWLRIPKGDEYNLIKNPGGYKLPSYPEYEKVVNLAKAAGFSAKGSSQSLKKITYVDLERMGLIKRGRIDKKGKFVENNFTKSRFYPTHVRISKLGKNICLSSNHIKNTSDIAKAFMRTWGYEYDILYDLIFTKGLGSITIEEYAFFVSWINSNPINGISINECKKLIIDWRSLGKNVKESTLEFFKKNSRGSKSKKNYDFWDWNNWKNEPMSIFNILSGSKLFIYDKSKNALVTSITKKGSFKRTVSIIKEYDKWHDISGNVKKNSGFEYHHIIPFSWISDNKSHSIIDNHKNCIYISGTSHNKLPKMNNTLVKLRHDNKGNLILYSLSGGEIHLKIGVDVHIKKENIPEMIKYNSEAINELK